MTSTGQLPEPWKKTAATLFNPYVNLNRIANSTRQHSVHPRVLTPTRHPRAPPESLVGTGTLKVPTSDSTKRPKSKHFPSANAAEEVSIYVQQMIHNQFCGRSGTPSDMRYDDQKLRRTISTPHNSSLGFRKRIPSSKKQSRVSDYSLDDFFNTTDEQMSRMASLMPGRESSFSENYSLRSESPRRKQNGEGLTLADMCHIASNVGDKMSQSKEKVGLEAIRGFRLPSARLTYEPYEHHPMEAPLVLGQHIVSDRVRLSDVLTDDNFSNEPMIEIVSSDLIDEKIPRISRTQLKSTTPIASKINEFKDWRGKMSQPNLPDVRNRFRRQRSARSISPQRPCTAASTLPKSRPDSTGAYMKISQKDEEEIPSSASGYIPSASASTVLKNPSNNKQRQRNYPLNVRINEVNVEQDHDQTTITDATAPSQSADNITDPPGLSLNSESNDERLKTGELIPHPTPDPITSTSSTPFTMYTHDSHIPENFESDPIRNKRNYKLIASSSRQVYRTTTDVNQNSNTNQSNEQFTQLTLSQLELLANYDPMISAKIGVPFIPVQMLARPRDAQHSSRRSIQQIERDYPRKNGQPVFEPRRSRSSQNLIDIAQTLQLTKSKRVHVERQTTFEKPENETSIGQSVQIRSLENPNRFALTLYSPSEQPSLVKHTNSTRTSSKAQPSQLDDNSTVQHYIDQQTNVSEQLKEEDGMNYLENNLSVINIRTQQEVDQTRRREKPNQRRVIFPTSIVTNANLNSPQQRNSKHHGRPIPSVFLTQDPDEYNYSTSIYRQARSDADVKRAFKGFIVQNIQRKLSADERKRREDQQKAAIKIQRSYREHLQRRNDIETRRPSTSQSRDQERQHRIILSAKRAQSVEQQLIEQTKIREENKEYQKMIEQTGSSLQIFKSFNQTDAQFSKSTLNRAATCIQRWWRGFIVRHRWNYLKGEVAASGLTWFDFSSRYRGVIQRIQKIRQSEYKQFIFNLDQARDFLVIEKKLTTIYNTLSFNEKLDEDELEKFFQCCNLTATPGEIQEALETVLQYYPHKKNDSLTKDIVFDIVHYIYPPVATGLQTSRKSTWVRPIIDGEDETAIQGTPFLEPIDMSIVYKFLGKE